MNFLEDDFTVKEKSIKKTHVMHIYDQIVMYCFIKPNVITIYDKYVCLYILYLTRERAILPMSQYFDEKLICSYILHILVVKTCLET